MSAAPARELDREQWEDAVSHTFTPLAIAGADGGFSGTIRTIDVGRGTALSELRHGACEVLRTERGIRRSDDHSLYLSINLADSMTVQQGERSTTLGHGAAAFYVSSMPYRLDLAAGGTRQLVLQVSRDALPVAQRAQLDALIRPLPAASTELGILQAFLEGLLGTPETALATSADVLHQTAVDLTALAVQAALGAAALRRVPREHLYEAMLGAIRTQAQDPGFGPDALAERFHVSRRLLFQVFDENGAAPAAAIRRERLRRAAILLRGTALPIGTIARRTGFGDLATFGRAFRRERGMLPSEWRSGSGRPEGPGVPSQAASSASTVPSTEVDA